MRLRLEVERLHLGAELRQPLPAVFRRRVRREELRRPLAPGFLHLFPERDGGPGVVSGAGRELDADPVGFALADRKSTRLNSSHQIISYAVFCLKKKKNTQTYKTL